ncbi:MAG TPA: TPM domain-containing protein [Longimicrobium sp.]|nr:TPM domain-containing protein [Longimicrobium sp.]
MNVRVLGLLAPLVFAASTAAAQGGYPEWNGRSVQDLAGVLSPKMEDSVRTLLAPVRNQGIDVRVVTIGRMSRYDVGATTIEGFAQGLFNAWRVGDRPENDGVLLLVATGDRKVRIQLGDGALRYQSAAQQVVSDSLVRWFREDKMVRGILRGTAGIAQWYTPQGQAAFAPPPPPEPTYTPQPAYSPPSGSGGGGGFVPGIVGMGILFASFLGFRGWLRNRPRICPQCNTQMARLDEVSDDMYLDSGQKTEEYLNSVNYDVWKCGACGTHTLLRQARWFSSKGTCPSCRYQTVETSRNVLEYATYDHSGSEEVLRDCRHCGYHDRDVVYLPRKTRPTHHHHHHHHSSSASSSSSYSSSSSSSSGGGGGGGGGGYSSGGGASGSW